MEQTPDESKPKKTIVIKRCTQCQLIGATMCFGLTAWSLFEFRRTSLIFEKRLFGTICAGSVVLGVYSLTKNTITIDL